jgi:hypothetical protein
VYETFDAPAIALVSLPAPHSRSHDAGDEPHRVRRHDGWHHEYNFGLKDRAGARRCPVSVALGQYRGGARRQGAPYAPSIVKTIAGVKVAVIGITTPAVPAWEKPENYGSYRFEAAPAAVKKRSPNCAPASTRTWCW